MIKLSVAVTALLVGLLLSACGKSKSVTDYSTMSPQQLLVEAKQAGISISAETDGRLSINPRNSHAQLLGALLLKEEEVVDLLDPDIRIRKLM